jgi:hypothetical protein
VRPKMPHLVLMNDSRNFYALKSNPAFGKFVLNTGTRRKPNPESFTYSRPTSEELLLQGKFSGSKLSVLLRRANENKLLLMNHGLTWISERGFNR